MLKAKIKMGSESDVYLIGLSAHDLKRLLDDKQIVINATDLSLPDVGRIVLTYGKTDKEIETKLLMLGAKSREPF
jgi:hypothetical protein